MDDEKRIEIAVRAAIRETFGNACSTTDAATVQQWIYDHEHTLPYAIRLILGAAHNAAVETGAYPD